MQQLWAVSSVVERLVYTHRWEVISRWSQVISSSMPLPLPYPHVIPITSEMSRSVYRAVDKGRLHACHSVSSEEDRNLPAARSVAPALPVIFRFPFSLT